MQKKRVAGAILACAVAGGAAAQEAGQTILVLDASGSMWGQIDGTAKITIAQDVVRRLLRELPEGQQIGLTAYGHRRKGDCGDIETLVLPGAANRADVAAAVDALSPKGKTPLSAAVAEAARALRHTEQKATVILVSDGIETCEADPCAVAAELEGAGVDFTAHVIGFDVADPAATAQLQCVAANTGGQYRSASDADELARALEEVAAAPAPQPAPEPEPEPEPAPEVIAPIVVEGPRSVPASAAVEYVVQGDFKATDFLAFTDTSGAVLTYKTMVNGAAVTLQAPAEPGSYELRFLDDGGEGRVRATIPIEVTELVPALDAPEVVAAGSIVRVRWVGPATPNDFLTIAEQGESGGYLTASDYLVSGGNPIEIQAPDAPGTYELRYIYGEGRDFLVRQLIRVE